MVLRSSQGENRVLEPGPGGLAGAQNVRAGRGLRVRSNRYRTTFPSHRHAHIHMFSHRNMEFYINERESRRWGWAPRCSGVSVERGFLVHPAAVTSNHRLGGRGGEAGRCFNSRHFSRDAGKFKIKLPVDPVSGEDRSWFADGCLPAAPSHSGAGAGGRRRGLVSRLMRMLTLLSRAPPHDLIAPDGPSSKTIAVEVRILTYSSRWQVWTQTFDPEHIV